MKSHVNLFFFKSIENIFKSKFLYMKYWALNNVGYFVDIHKL